MREFTYIANEPMWEAVPLVQGTLVSYKIPTAVRQIINGNFERESRLARFKITLNPFTHGAERAAFYALEFHNLRVGGGDNINDHPGGLTVAEVAFATEIVVLKTFLREGNGSAVEGNRFLNAMETQTTASYLAIQFNRLIKNATGDSRHQLKFLRANILRIGRNTPFQFFSVEKRYRDYAANGFVELSNNAGHVAASDQLYVAYAMAFSHWTWHCTGGYLIVVDLQGQRIEGDKLLLTDPAIHCSDRTRFSSGTNLGTEGIEEFFRTHECNKFCRSLGLKSRDEQLAEWETGAHAQSEADIPRHRR